MSVIETNLSTGEVVVREYTEKERADIAAAILETDSKTPRQPTKEELLAQIQELVSKVEALP